MEVSGFPSKLSPLSVTSSHVFAGIVDKTMVSMRQNLKENPVRRSQPEELAWSQKRVGGISETKRSLRLKTRQDHQDRFVSNISLAKLWLKATFLALDQLDVLLLKAKEMTIQTTDKTSDRVVWTRTAKELGKLLAKMLAIVDSQDTRGYPFSQWQAITPFSPKAPRGPAGRSNNERMELEIQPGLNMKLNSLDSSLLTKPLRTLGEDYDLNPRIDLNTRLSDLNLGRGISLGSIRMNDAISCWDINLHRAAAVGEVIEAINTSGIEGVGSDLNASRTGFKLSHIRSDEGCSAKGLSISKTDGDTAKDSGILNNSVEESTIPPGGLEGQDLGCILTEKTFTSLLKDDRGMILGTINLALGDSEVVIDLGTASTIGEIIDAINDSVPDVIASLSNSKRGISVESKVAGKSLVISDGDERKSAHALGISGSADVLGALLFAMEGLKNGDRKAISEGLETLDLGLKEVSNHRAKAGAKLKRLESAEARLTAFEPDIPRLFSEVSREDVSRAAADLANQQSLFRSVLKRGAAIIQPAFLDFIR